MVEIDLRRREDIPEFEDFDKFCNSGKEAPDVYLFMHITYAIKDIEVTTKQFLGTYRLPVQKQTLLEHMNANDFFKVSEQLLSSVDKTKHVFYTGSPDDEISYGSYKLISKMHKLKKTKFTGNLPKKITKDTMKSEDVLDSYILYRTGKHSICESTFDVTPKNAAEIDIRKLMHQILEDKKEYKEAKTFDDAVKFICGLKDIATADVKAMIQRMEVGHKIWDALSSDEIYYLLNTEDDSIFDRVPLAEIEAFKTK